jgi:hypothetical protein
MLSLTLQIAPNGTLPACLTVRSQHSLQDALQHISQHTVEYTLNCTSQPLPVCLSQPVYSSSQDGSKYTLKYALEHTANCTGGHHAVCLTSSQVLPQDNLKYPLRREVTLDFNWQYAAQWTPTCSIPRLAAVQILDARKNLDGGMCREVTCRWAVEGVSHVACGRWLVVYVSQNDDIGWYHTLILILCIATTTRSHNALIVQFWQQQPMIRQES